MFLYYFPNNKKAMMSVMTTLNDCAIKKAYNGFLLLLANKSLKFVSNPMLVKAKANQRPCRFFKLSFTPSLTSGAIRKEKIREAAIKPMTNLGKRSQITFKVGLDSTASVELL